MPQNSPPLVNPSQLEFEVILIMASVIYFESEEFIPDPIIIDPSSESLNINSAIPDLFVTVNLLVIGSFISTDKYPAVELFILEKVGNEFILKGEFVIAPSIGKTGKFPKLEQPAPFN